LSELATIFGLSVVIAFLVALALRLGASSKSQYERGFENVGFALRISEYFLFSMGGLVLTTLLFLLMEITATSSYAAVLKVLFITFQVIIGTFSVVGAFVFAVVLVLAGVSKVFGNWKK